MPYLTRHAKYRQSKYTKEEIVNGDSILIGGIGGGVGSPQPGSTTTWGYKIIGKFQIKKKIINTFITYDVYKVETVHDTSGLYLYSDTNLNICVYGRLMAPGSIGRVYGVYGPLDYTTIPIVTPSCTTS